MSPSSDLAFARAARLRHGVNLSHWFSQIYKPPGYVAQHFDHYIHVADIAIIRDLGFDHVRLPINCEPIFATPVADGTLPPAHIERLRTRILEILDHDLAVIVDIHPEDAFKKRLAASDDAVSAFVAFWIQLASAFADLDPQRVVFEILNEPCIRDAARWNHIQNTTAAAIRRVAPLHTLVLSGDRWSELPELLKLELPQDANVLLNFHLYDPSAFTHQGARWASPWCRLIKGLNYPTDPKNVAELKTQITDPDALRHLDEYTELRWDADAYRRFLQPTIAFARAHRLPLLCNEFGVYKAYSPRASRLAWLRDVSATLTAHDIGWTMWDYAGDFAVVVKDESGMRVPDHEVVAALDLRPR
jgi:endoglucanase